MHLKKKRKKQTKTSVWFHTKTLSIAHLRQEIKSTVVHSSRHSDQIERLLIGTLAALWIEVRQRLTSPYSPSDHSQQRISVYDSDLSRWAPLVHPTTHRLPDSLHLLSGSLLSLLTFPTVAGSTKGCRESVKIKSVACKRCYAGLQNLIAASDSNSGRSKGLRVQFAVRWFI